MGFQMKIKTLFLASGSRIDPHLQVGLLILMKI